MTHKKIASVYVFLILALATANSCKKSKEAPPDNVHGVLYYSAADELHRFDLKDKQETIIYSNGSNSHIALDGEKFVWYKNNFGQGSTSIQIHNTQSPDDYQTISIPYLLEATPKFAPNTTLLGALARSSDEPVNRTDLLLFDNEGKVIGSIPHVKDFAFSNNGKDLILSAEALNSNGESVGFALALIEGYRSETSRSITLSEFTDYDQLPAAVAISPDNSRLAYTHQDHLYTIAVKESSTPKQITTSRFKETDAGWSPDARYLIFVANVTDQTECGEIRVVPSDPDTPVQVPDEGYDNAPVDPLQPVDGNGKVIHACSSESILWME